MVADFSYLDFFWDNTTQAPIQTDFRVGQVYCVWPSEMLTGPTYLPFPVDVFGLGGILFFLVTGKRAYQFTTDEPIDSVLQLHRARDYRNRWV